MENVQIALVDDHKLFRSGIASLINNFKGFKILFEAGNGEEMVRRISSKLKPDIVLLDIHMPVMDGAATALWLKENYPEIRIIVLSMLEDPEKVLTMLKLGAKGYLLKKSPAAELVQAIEQIHAGGAPMSMQIARKVVEHFNQLPQQTSELEKLTKREHEVLSLLAQRMTKLPEIQKKVLAMYYYENMKLSEIARCFGLTESRICQIHTQTVGVLRNYLANMLV